MKKRSSWTKTTGAIALGLMVLSPVASYAVDLNLPAATQERVQTRASEQNGQGSKNRYMDTEESRSQEKKMANKKGDKSRSEARERNEKREHKDGDYDHDRQNRGSAGSGEYDSGSGRGRSRGRGR